MPNHRAINNKGEELELINNQWVPIASNRTGQPNLSQADPDQLNAVFRQWAESQNKKEIKKIVEDNPVFNRLAAFTKGATSNFFDELVGQFGETTGLSQFPQEAIY